MIIHELKEYILKAYYKKFKQIPIPEDKSNLKEAYYNLLDKYDEKRLSNIKFEMIRSLKNGFSFYRYRSVNEYTIDSIKKEKIWFSTPDQYNDPFEFHLKLGNEELINIIEKVLPETNLDEVLEYQKQFYERKELSKKEFSICCFMENDESNLMWSHYADYHKGFCIEYDLSNDCFCDFLYPVYYTKDVMELPKNYAKVCITKSEEWNYELEWRMIYLGQSGLQDAPPIKSICLGARFDEQGELSKQLLQIVAERNIPIYKMVISKTSYSLIKKGPLRLT